MPATTQQISSPVQPTITAPQNKNTAFPQTNTQSTVKPSVFPNYSQMDYQSYRPIIKSRQSNQQKPSIRINY